MSHQESIFTSLLNNYRRPVYFQTPQEDFCTECLAGILRSDTELRNSFVNDVLNIRSDSKEYFSIYTQKNYLDSEKNESKIDLVFESRNWICYLEVKVKSPEHEGQLEKYAKLLEEYKKEKEYRALRYCTLFYDEKEKNIHENFQQFRWKDVADFISNYTQDNELVKEFYNFLTEQNMAGNERFNHLDLAILENYWEHTKKLESLFEGFEDVLKQNFTTVGGGVNNSKQISNHKRHLICCDNVFGSGNSEVIISIDFEDSSQHKSYDTGPVVMVALLADQKNSSYEKFKTKAKDMNYEFEVRGYGGIRLKKPLSDFIEKEDQFSEINNWVTEQIDELVSLKQKTPELEWHY